MKRLVLALLFLLSVPLYAVQISSVDDVIRMHRAGIDAELLLSIVQTPHEAFEVTDDDVRAMHEAGVPAAVIDALLAQNASRRSEQVAEAEDDDDTVSNSGDWCITFEPIIPLYWPDYYLIPRWIWDPHWFMPRYDGQVGKGESGKGSPTQTAKARPPKSERPAKERWPIAVDFAAALARAVKR